MCILTGDNGTLTFWDYNTRTPFQNLEDVPQPGSLEAEAGVFCSTFDQTGTWLIMGGTDKTIKVKSFCYYDGTLSFYWQIFPDIHWAITVILDFV
jgi:pleiotropic regulator 1